MVNTGSILFGPPPWKIFCRRPCLNKLQYLLKSHEIKQKDFEYQNFSIELIEMSHPIIIRMPRSTEQIMMSDLFLMVFEPNLKAIALPDLRMNELSHVAEIEPRSETDKFARSEPDPHVQSGTLHAASGFDRVKI